MSRQLSSRSISAKIIYQVIINRRSLDAALFQTDLSTMTDKDQRFIHELCYGSIRWYQRLCPIARELLHKPLPDSHQDVFCVLIIGLYQLIYCRTPDYAAISETVKAVKQLNKTWAQGLINKTLRVFVQNRDKILAEVDSRPAFKVSHPNWLVKKINNQWSEQADSILLANNSPAPMTIRINPQQTNVEDYLKLLTDKEIEAKIIKELPYAIQLEHPINVFKLPNFSQGACYVQDQAGQYAAPLLLLKPGLRVLDACAAPGSKTTDMLSTEPNIKQLTAIDKDPKRLEKITENLQRLKIDQKNIQLLSADAIDVDKWWDGEQYDRILIDAPCSATGVIRRHPDIKLLRTFADIEQQQEQQQLLLYTLWPLLKTGGLLLYSTCSILKEENELNIESFLAHHPNAQVSPISIRSSEPLKFGSQLLPNPNGPDGFYYARLQKK